MVFSEVNASLKGDVIKAKDVKEYHI
jgi:hypothetical protein